MPWRADCGATIGNQIYCGGVLSVRSAEAASHIEDVCLCSRTPAGIGAYVGSIQQSCKADRVNRLSSQLDPEALSLLGVHPVIDQLFLQEENREGVDVHKSLLC